MLKKDDLVNLFEIEDNLLKKYIEILDTSIKKPKNLNLSKSEKQFIV